MRCHGIRIEPSALALATALPETPPNTTEATTVVDSGPPRKRPINSVAKASSSLPSFPPIMRLPASMKKGSASIGKDWVWANICCAMIISGKLPCHSRAAPEAMIRA